MRLSIIVVDKTVYVDGFSISELIWGGTPEGIHALQWDGTVGHIEFIGHIKANESIVELPQWASNAKHAWDVQKEIINAELLRAATYTDIQTDTDIVP